jgi:hypothetical protein
MDSLSFALLAFGVSLVVLDIIERWWHERQHDHSRYYRWGVWVFASLIGLYAFITSIGRT